MCMIGSLILSTILLSTSVFSPSIVSRTSLFNFFFMSRTIRFIFWNVPETGTILRDIAMSCKSSVSLRSCRVDFRKLSSFRFWISGEEVTIDSVITISPTIAMRLSSLERLTLIKLCFAGVPEEDAAEEALPDAGAETADG